MIKEKNVLTKVLKHEFTNKHITISTLKKTKITAELYALVLMKLYAQKIRRN